MSLPNQEPANYDVRCTCAHSRDGGDLPDAESQELTDEQWLCGHTASVLVVWKCPDCVHQHSDLLCTRCVSTRADQPETPARTFQLVAEHA